MEVGKNVSAFVLVSQTCGREEGVQKSDDYFFFPKWKDPTRISQAPGLTLYTMWCSFSGTINLAFLLPLWHHYHREGTV